MATKHLAQGLAGLGRNGDSVLVHMQPEEVAGLQSLAKANGTSLTINPHTGLPEAFSLGGFFSSLLPVLAGGLTGGAGAPLWAGIAAGAATGAATSKDPLKGALMGGLGGYGGYNIGSGLANMSAANAAANPEGFANAAGINASNAEAAGALSQGQMPSTIGNSLADNAAFLNQGINPQITQSVIQSGGNVADPITQGWMKSAGENLARSGQNLSDVATMQPGAWDSFKQGMAGVGETPLTNMQAATKLGMPLGGAVLSGLEPSDIYGDPMKPDSRGKYDPYATLTLPSDTGLRLYAEGGLAQLYGSQDGNQADNTPADGYGLGRLQQLSQGGATAYAEGGETGLNLDEIPALNLNTGASSPMGGDGQLYTFGEGPFGPLSKELLRKMSSAQRAEFMNSGMGGWMGINKIPKKEYLDSSGNFVSRYSYAEGGGLESGGFVIPSDVVSHLGNGSTDAGLAVLRTKVRAHPIKGAGDGMSDNIHTNIDGKQEARVADGEAYVPADEVARQGGAKKFYNMMDKVRKARTGSTKQGKQINPDKYLPS